MKLNKIRIIVSVILIYIILTISFVSAETIEFTTNRTNILFVVDKSNSMNNMKKTEIIKDITKEFISKLYDEHTEFSYLTYNQNIINFTKKLNINSNEELDKFYKKLHSKQNRGYSDLGLGLKKSKEIILSNEFKKDKFIVVLITDGEITVPEYTNRTLEESKQDMNDAINFFEENKIPMITIDFNLNNYTNFLDQKTKETNGIYYNVFSPEYELNEIINNTIDIKLNLNKILEIQIPNYIEKNREFFVEAVFKDRSGKIIKDKDFYEDFDANVYLENENNKYNLVPKIFDYKIILKNKVLNSGDYNLNLEFENKYLKYNYIKEGYIVKNDEPKNDFYKNIKLPISQNDKIFELDRYFKDPNKDSISYKLKTDDEEIKIENNKLVIKINKIKKSDFEIIYYDNENSINKTNLIEVNIISKLDYYKNYIILVFISIIALLIVYIYRLYKDENKKNFNGKLNMYFIRTKDYNEIEPLTFYVYEYENYKKLSLFELFKKEYLEFENINLNKIYFRPYYNNQIKLVNHSNSTVMINSNILRKYECKILDYKSNIHITFEDNYTELEIHFRKI
ncbi:vWA domain-containing protein [Peptostreptococcaceae bacterium AGR-M142]